MTPPFQPLRPILSLPPVPKFYAPPIEMAYQNQPFNYYMPDFERNEPNGYPGMMPPKFANVFLDECSYTIERKKMNLIASNIDKYFTEIPEGFKNEINFERETEELRDSTLTFEARDRRALSHKYNYSLLNDLSSKIKSCDEISIEDLSIIIFLIQRTISDMKSVGRAGRGYTLNAYELRRRGFQVNPKELLDFLEKMRYR